MKKTYVKANYVPKRCHSYITPGKEYELTDGYDHGLFVSGTIVDNDGDNITIITIGCSFLDGRDWTLIIKDEG